jgi:hypothetical protein
MSFVPRIAYSFSSGHRTSNELFVLKIDDILENCVPNLQYVIPELVPLQSKVFYHFISLTVST